MAAGRPGHDPASPSTDQDGEHKIMTFDTRPQTARARAGARLVDRLTAQLRDVEHGNMMAANHRGECVIGGDPIRRGEAIARQWGSDQWSHVNCVLVTGLGPTVGP